MVHRLLGRGRRPLRGLGAVVRHLGRGRPLWGHRRELLPDGLTCGSRRSLPRRRRPKRKQSDVAAMPVRDGLDTAAMAERVTATTGTGSGVMMATMFMARDSTVGRLLVAAEDSMGTMAADRDAGSRDRPEILWKVSLAPMTGSGVGIVSAAGKGEGGAHLHRAHLHHRRLSRRRRRPKWR